MGLLDLSGADLSGFSAMPSGKYAASVFEAEMTQTKNEGKVPAGTPMLKVQFVVHDRLDDASDETNYENRRLFQNFVIPPKGHDKEKAAKLKGMLVRFLTAIGYEESEVTSAKFNLDVEDLVGKEVQLTVGQETAYGSDPADNEMQNNIKAIKPIDAAVGAGSSGGLL